MEKESLKKLAEETFSKIDPGGVDAENINRIALALERVQRETLEARIEWPSDEEIKKGYHEIWNFPWPFKESVTERFYLWLRENVKLVPKKVKND